MIQAFARIQTTDRTVNQLQDSIGKAVDNLNQIPLNNGILLSDIDLATGDNTVYTQLPGPLTGWFVVRKSAAADIYDKQSTNTNTATLILNTSADVTVSLFVF